ncbi:MAG: ATP--guanido phosphotransferase [Clostridia bacterium]|nr:ATP--guanido phosphotransferase [Clostridia bacterium]MDE6356437.1 ATP--guanido phosphotransferase [Clostridia bacterium]
MDNYAGTVVTTRIRLARNLEGYPFPSHLKSDKQAKEIIRLASSGLSRLEEFRLLYMDGVTEDEAQSLIENHLISPALLNNRRRSAVLINREENISVMINEEDHLREQCIVKGLDLRFAYETMSEVDGCISGTMKFAFDEQLGYLTACPTNLGTGLRASVMMFLPALTLGGIMPRIMKSVARLGLTVRGIYGEGSAAEGYTYQISNEVTLGVTEPEILEGVEEVVGKICKLEEAERERLATGASALEIQDECLRSFGILSNCAKLSCEELTKLAANVKLGAALGYIKLNDISKIDELVKKMRPSNIMEAAAKKLTALERDVYRAQYTGRFLKKITQQ